MMKELTYKGTTLQYHRVKGKKAPKIEQVSEQTYQATPQQKSKEQQLFDKLTNPKNGRLTQPQFEVYIDQDKCHEFDLECKDIKILYIDIELPLLIHSRGIHLEANEEMLYLFVKGIYQIYLRMPMSIGKYKAKFVKNRRVLEVVAQIKQRVQEAKQQQNKEKVSVRIESDLLNDLV